MKIYFLSSTPCALTVNGVFYGITDRFERFLEVDPNDQLYAQFSPEGAHPLGFFITESIRAHPPDGCEVYLLREGIAVYARDFPCADFTLRPIAQKREGDRLVTVFRQGNTQLSIESPKGYFNATIPPSFAPCEIYFHNNFILLRGADTLGVFTLSCQSLLIEKILEYRVEGEFLHATLPLFDRLGRTANCTWHLQEEELALTDFSLRQAAPEPHLQDIPDGLFAYAFFECVLLHGDCAPFLCEELQSEKTRILDFLGNFIAVTLTEKETECGLVRKKGERLFAVDYFSVEISDGKITDVKG